MLLINLNLSIYYKYTQINGKADFALADLYYTPYNLEKMDLSIPYTTQCLTFLTPASSTDNSWQTLILPFRYIYR